MTNACGVIPFNLRFTYSIFCFLLLSLIVSKNNSNPNAFTYKWVDLSPGEMSRWYTKTDLCLLNNTWDRYKFPQDLRADMPCREFSGGSRRLHCGVGMGSNQKACYSPYGPARKSFFRGIEGFTDPDKKPILTAMRRFKAANTSLIFIGDSTMRQKLNALDCELMREDPGMHLIGNFAFGILPCHTELKIKLPGKEGFIYLHGLSMGPKSTECLKKELGGVGWDDKGPNAAQNIITGAFEYPRYFIRKVNHEYGNSVFVMANIGLWYNDEDVFNPVVGPVLDWLVDVSKERVNGVKNIVSWHETMSQHWPNKIGSGYFYKNMVDDQEASWGDGRVNLTAVPFSELQVPHCCVKITNTSYMADWRNDIVKEKLKENNRESFVNYVKFAEITREPADMHVCNQAYSHDCTHYCYWPLLWQPLWHTLEHFSSFFVKPEALA